MSRIGCVAATESGREAAAYLESRWPNEIEIVAGDSVADSLRAAFRDCDAVVAFLATGATVRILAPLLGHKTTDAPVVCVDEGRRYAVALLGGHYGANDLARRVAAAIGADPVISNARDAEGIKPLPPLPSPTPATSASTKRIVVGVGASRGVSAEEVLETVDAALARAGLSAADVSELATADLKSDEPGIRHAAGLRGWPLTCHPAAELAEVEVPNPSEVVRAAAGTPSVAEASARHAGPGREPGRLLVHKTKSAREYPMATAAVAEHEAHEDSSGVRPTARKTPAVPEEAAVPERGDHGDGSGVLATARKTSVVPEGATVPERGDYGEDSGDLATARKTSVVREEGTATEHGDHGKGPGVLAAARKTSVVPGEAAVPERGDRGEGPGDLAAATAFSTPVVSEAADNPDQHVTAGVDHAVVAAASPAGVTDRGRLAVIGLGPGARDLTAPRALAELRAAEIVVGLDQYVDQIRDVLSPDVRVEVTGLGAEEQRARSAVDLARAGHRVALIGSGDAGVYAMASPALDHAETGEIDVVCIPGITAATAASNVLGAPLGHDHCSISLSDLHTPWPAIERRVRAAAEGDFVVSFYNPRSAKRDWQLPKALAVLAEHRPGTTPVGWVRNAGRPDQSHGLTTLAEFDPGVIDMYTTVIVGCSQSRIVAGRFVTPRGYQWAAQ